MENMTLIPIEKLYPHPDNPRKDLGDLQELADSIKENGVFQNLTVVRRVGEITGDPLDCFTVIIGHRRLAAAKKAGMKELPCVIVEMSLSEQVRTMLIENMQRTDLTVYEQAQGFQMMLDMGDTVETLSEKMGFSKTTVRSRVKLLELDKEKFKQAEKRGATLSDYAKLNQIEDAEERNKVLESIGTNNFQRELQSAIESQKDKQRIAEWLEIIKTFAEEISEVTGKRYVRNYSRWSNNKTVEIPEDSDAVNYYYKESRLQIDIYKDIDKQAEDAETKEREERRRKQDEIENKYREITCSHFDLRSAFVRDLPNSVCKKHFSEISVFVSEAVLKISLDGYGRPRLDVDLLLELLGCENEDEYREDISRLSYLTSVATVSEKTPEKLLLCVALASVDDDCEGYYQKKWENGAYRFFHFENEDLDDVYSLLESLGYEMSDDEIAMQNGTHELFNREEN